MKKLIIFLIAIFINAETLNFILPDGLVEHNSTTNTVKNENIEINTTSTITEDELDFNDTYVTIANKANIAVIINKDKFFKYIPSLMNALNAYLIQKNIDYNITLYDIDQNISNITSNDIIYVSTNVDKLNELKEYNKTFYFPLINKNETNITAKNFYFGAINYKTQINTLSQFIDDKTDIITDKTLTANKLLYYEKNLTFINNIYQFPNIYYKDLNNSFVFFNTSSGKTAQVLSRITQKEIDTKLLLAPQIDFSPLIISLTQPKDIEKLIIANSIINPPLFINEYANLINSDIKYNYLNYASAVLLNKAYNKQNNLDEFYMSDFNIYIFDNQVNYKTKLYRIIDGAFMEVK